MTKYDFTVNNHTFRIYKDGDLFRLRSLTYETKKKGKKMTQTEKESVEISNSDISVIKEYVDLYFMRRRTDEVEEALDGIILKLQNIDGDKNG